MFLELYYKGAPVTLGNSRIENAAKASLPNKVTFFKAPLWSLFEEHSQFRFTTKQWTQRRFWNTFCWFFWYQNRNSHDRKLNTHLAYLLFWDMLALYKAWRHCRGYPVNGQRTWSNGKSASKNNTALKAFRLKQFKEAFGARRKTSYAMVIQAEIINRLWLKTWPAEWLQGHLHAIKSKSRKSFNIPIDLANLARGVTTGYLRRGQAAKWNKSKKALRTVTIGLPIYFSRFFFGNTKRRHFKYQLIQLQPDFKNPQKKKKLKKKLKKK